MRIDISLVSVSGPTRVSNSYIMIVFSSTLNRHALDAVAAESVGAGKFSQDPLRLVFFVTSNGHDTTRVVAARLQYLETLDANRASLRSISKIANDSTTLIVQFLCLHHLLVEHETSEEH